MIRVFTLLVLTLASITLAAGECDLDTGTFPNSDCSFSTPFETEQLKFGKLRNVVNSGNAIFIGTARFTLDNNIEIFDAAEPGCDYNENELEGAVIGEEIAFKVSEINSREITQLWLLRCTLDNAR